MKSKAAQSRKKICIKDKRGLDDRIEIFKEDLARQVAEETYDLIQDLRRKGVIRDE